MTKRKYTKRRTYGDPELWRTVEQVLFVPSSWSKHWRDRGNNLLTLFCGHKQLRRASVPIPEVVFCKECAKKVRYLAIPQRPGSLNGGAQ